MKIYEQVFEIIFSSIFLYTYIRNRLILSIGRPINRMSNVIMLLVSLQCLKYPELIITEKSDKHNGNVTLPVTLYIYYLGPGADIVLDLVSVPIVIMKSTLISNVF